MNYQWIIEQDYKNKCLVTGDWSQSNCQSVPNVMESLFRRLGVQEVSRVVSFVKNCQNSTYCASGFVCNEP